MMKWLASILATGVAAPAFAASETLRMPAEWQKHDRCFMALCAAHEQYDDAEIQKVRNAQARVAKAIANFEPVTILVNEEDLSLAAKLCGPTVEILEMNHYDVWTRDTLPTFVESSSGLRAISWNFNTWGKKFPKDTGYEADWDLAVRMSDHLGIPLTHANIVSEGGAIETDGDGTLITTETCLLNPNRNPGMSRREIENELMRLTGCRKIIWLYGSDADNITNGHVDGIARFMKPGMVIAEIPSDPNDVEYEDLMHNAEQLENSRDARGRKLEVIRLERPRWDHMPEHGEDFAASYINCYEANGGIIMPRFGDRQKDDAARNLFASLRPHHEIVQVEVDAICEGGGGIHCNTQQLPIWEG